MFDYSLSHMFGRVVEEVEEKETPTYREMSYFYNIVGGGRYLDFQKSFDVYHQAGKDLTDALLQGPPAGEIQKMRLPIAIGKCASSLNDEGGVKELAGKVTFMDLTEGNLLVAGRTRSGKTHFINGLLATLFHFSHPQFCRIVCLDSKRTSFKDLHTTQRRVATVATDYDKITQTLERLVIEMKRRFSILQREGQPTNIKKLNSTAYKSQREEDVTPYIVVVFDEFADYIHWARKKKLVKDQDSGGKEQERGAEEQLVHSLAAMGLAAGIHLVFATQSPYTDVINGLIRNNFQHRLSFALSEPVHSTTIFGTRLKEKDPRNPFNLRNGGWFVFKEDSTYRLGRALNVSQYNLLKQAEELASRGYDYSF